MLTKKEFRQFEVLLRKVLKDGYKNQHEDLLSIDKRLDGLEKNIIKKLDKFTPILERLGRKQRILEKKMRAIEDYFEHRN